MGLPGEGDGPRGKAQQRSESLVHDKRERGPVSEPLACSDCGNAVSEHAVQHPRANSHSPLQSRARSLPLLLRKRAPWQPC
jgi:hypothetical protein